MTLSEEENKKAFIEHYTTFLLPEEDDKLFKERADIAKYLIENHALKEGDFIQVIGNNFNIVRKNNEPITPSIPLPKFQSDMSKELANARYMFGPIHSLHEGYAIILEELDELWTEVKKRRIDQDYNEIYKELVQIAAMAQKTTEDVLKKKG